MPSSDLILLTFVKLQDELCVEEFATFALEQDLPTWRDKKVVRSFDTYRVPTEDRARLGAEFIEMMVVRSLAELNEVSREDPAIPPLAARFSQLVDESATYRVVLDPQASVEANAGAASREDQ